jgi:uncharacterized protein (UPF0254 family)
MNHSQNRNQFLLDLVADALFEVLGQKVIIQTERSLGGGCINHVKTGNKHWQLFSEVERQLCFGYFYSRSRKFAGIKKGCRRFSGYTPSICRKVG